MAKKKNTSPTNSSGACLCENGTYSKECCKGELINQGIGQLSNQNNAVVNHTIQVRVING